MKRIKLTQGKVALVDDADFKWLNRWKWQADRMGYRFYATRKDYCPANQKESKIYMHRAIIGLKRGDGKHTDHIDGNTLDNQRCNLRICTRQQNYFNQKPRGYSSKYKGIYQYRGRGKWQARITYNYKGIRIGRFESEIDAARAYDKKARELFGKFARLNFPLEER